MYNVMTGSYGQETNTFNPLQTELSAFGECKWTQSVFRAALSVRDDINIVDSVSLYAEPWGVVRRSAHECIKERFLSAIDAAGTIDGILLYLHGAMVTENCEDGEGDLLEALRMKVGMAIPIMVVLDLHANITEKMIRNSTAFFVYHTYPHIDIKESCIKAAETLIATLDGKVKPLMFCRKLPLLQEFIPTADPRLKKFSDMIAGYEEKPQVLSASVAYGFFCADIYEGGVTVVAITDNDEKLAKNITDKLGNAIWNDRANLRRKFFSIDEGIDAALEQGSFPVVLADCCDNPGGGAPGDSTHILRRLLERGIKNAALATIYDPETVKQAAAAGVGSTISVKLGGKFFPEITGAPVIAEAYVKAFSDGNYNSDKSKCLGIYGPVAVLIIDEIEVLVASVRVQIFDWHIFPVCGIDAMSRNILVVKSTVAFRHSFSQIATAIIDIRSQGLAPQCIDDVKITRCRRPVYPLDDIVPEDYFEIKNM